MEDRDSLAKLRHDVANPLAAVLAEAQLLLMEPGKLAPEVVAALKTIEAQALKIRTLLRTL
ncbi:MAG: histidine kinase dimerization/phospho-acceptor domain-containing protein [Gemmatimonadota bacterium]